MTLPDDYLLALGRVVAVASMMDVEPMLAYVALSGKEAATDAAGQMTNWLIKHCLRLAREHRQITAEHRARIIAALNACDAANQERNRLIHDAWAFSGEDPLTLRSRRGTYLVTPRIWEVDDINSVADMIRTAYKEVLGPVGHAFGMTSLSLGWKLRQENQTDLPSDLRLAY